MNDVVYLASATIRDRRKVANDFGISCDLDGWTVEWFDANEHYAWLEFVADDGAAAFTLTIMPSSTDAYIYEVARMHGFADGSVVSVSFGYGEASGRWYASDGMGGLIDGERTLRDMLERVLVDGF